MDGFRDRLNSRYDRSERGGRFERDKERDDRFERDKERDDRFERPSERERSDYDRYDRAERVERGRRSSSDMDLGSLGDVIDKSNKNQLDVIADLFDEAKDDRLASEKTIVRAVDDNAQMLSDIAKALKSLQDNQGEAAQLPSSAGEKEEFFDEPSVDPSAKDEILKVAADNKQLLTLIRQDVITISQNQAQDTAAVVNEPVDIPDFLLASAAEQYYKDMEEHVHKENVKCYKNVQAAITEQGGASVKEFIKSLTGIKVMSILSLVFSAMSLLLIAAMVFGLI